MKEYMYTVTTIAAETDYGWRQAWRLINSLPAILLVIGLQSAAAASAGLNDNDMTRLKRGEILLETIHDEKSGGAARVTALFHTDASTVWNIIGYCKYELIYLRGLKLCEVLEPGQFHTTVHHRLRNSWYTPTLDFTFAASRTTWNHGEFHLLGGNLKVLEGKWKFVPLSDSNSIIVIHEIRIQPKMPAPKWLVRRRLRKDLPDMLACMRGLAKASEDKPLIARDLKRCPGDISSAEISVAPK